MTFDFTLNLPSLLTGSIAIVGVIVWLVRVDGKAEHTRGTVNAMEALVALHQQQFIAYRLEAAEKYVTRETVTEIKRDVIDEMSKMERRVEQAIDRAVKSVKAD